MRLLNILRVVLVVVLIGEPAGLSAAEEQRDDVVPKPIGAHQNLVPEVIVRLADSQGYYSHYAFLVDKSARTMEVWSQNGDGSYLQVAVYPADIGRMDGDKKHQGDFKTPEGIYFLLSRLEGTELDFNQYGKRAFVSDYPNYFDRILGKTGSGIWLHAVPDTVSLSRGSRGCVVVRNSVISEVSSYIALGRTPMIIANSIKYLNADEHTKRSQEINILLEQWRESWANKKIDDYMKFYGENFEAMKMNRAQWREYKRGLAEQYQFLRVTHVTPVVYLHGENIIVRMLQQYQSDKYSDFGEKILYLSRGGSGEYKIIGEDWRDVKENQAREFFDQYLAGKSSQSVSISPVTGSTARKPPASL